MLLKLHVILLLLLFFTISTSSTITTTKSKKKITTSIPISSGRILLQSSTYILQTSLGSPPQPLLLSLSTTSSFSWIPCSSSSSPSFSPSSSTTFLPLLCNSPSCPLLSTSSCPSPSSPCSSFSQDTISLSSSLIFPNFTFSCITTSTSPSQGLLSLSLSPSSFISQTNSIFSSTFSYCLPFFLSTNFSGSLLLGPSSQPKHLKTMPLLINPRRPSFYYVNLTGIRLGRKLIPVHSFDPSSGAGTVLDPGSMYTRLSAPDYAAVRDAFREYVNGTVTSLGGFDTCYDGPVNPPVVTLVFDRLQVKLPPENVMIHSSSGSLSCLAMYGAAENDTSGLNIIGSMQHQNHRILFDVPNRRVGIAREICTVS
ncbi:aspartyl protease AED3-like [Dioscorea cayenensis subsp. rotundata]|uniref:Aspartyl protease AED3-like n=1 Tax=Dioscorea cayennensis subsp. rotundata TaxID=55577 RepID=A0AB40BIM1_DIOCR|nr:aspartyl protease AED3-like [Dioscorea cayenensis subsp. rotundata]